MPPLETLGKYEIIEELGRGGFATVYKARDPGLNRSVALKVLHPYWSNDPGFAARFRREAQAAAGLHHPNIVSVYEAGEAAGQLYIAMAYLPGQTLRELLAAEGALSLERALPILTQIADALDYAHEQGAVHRDVKPANIMVEEHRRKVQATLLDFGLVKAIEESTALTSQGTLLGSPEYMAPEQADPEHASQVGPAADRYALGIVAYHMLTGRVPFPGNTPSTLNAHEHKPVPPPRSFQPELPEAVATVLLKMLAKAPDDRYPSACAFVEELERAWQAGQRAAQLVLLYARLQATVEGKSWTEALELGGQLQAIDPGYRDVSTVMAHARRQLQRSRGSTAPRQVPRWTWAVVGVAMVAVLLGLAYLGWGYLVAALLPRPTATTLPTGAATALPTATPAGTPTARPIPAAGATQVRSADEMTMVYVPAGTFPMGSADSNPNAQDDEKPRHQVILDAFWIDRTEVTNAQYARCVEAGACQKSALADDASFNGTDNPVVGVAWQAAADYCRWAGGRLPTEAEWEYAARGPEGRTYPWGDTFDASKVNTTGPGDGYEHTAPVGSFPAGASWVGALDMVGNVWEWVNDWFGSYPSEPQANPSGPPSGEKRALRGGSWSYSSEYAYAANRNDYAPDTDDTDVGFRCVLGLGATKVRSADGMVMVYVPPGEFKMGSSDTEVDYAVRLCSEHYGGCAKGLFEDERTARPAKLEGFWIDRTEATNAQYQQCVNAGKCQPPVNVGSYTREAYYGDGAYDNYPVTWVTWHQAVAYCEWVGARVPTEIEWEYAARGPKGWVFPWGSVFDGSRLNYCDVNCEREWRDQKINDGYADTAPVGTYPAGASWCGVLDLAGNVWEWTDSNYDGTMKVLRGGAWDEGPSLVRSANRGKNNVADSDQGFRCVKDFE